MEKLIQELKTKIIETLSLLDMTPDDIDTDAQLVGARHESVRLGQGISPVYP